MKHAGMSNRHAAASVAAMPLPAGRASRPLALLSMVVIILCGCAERTNTELYRSLPENEANRLVAFLDAHSIKAMKQAGREGVAVLVSAASLPLAARLSTDAGLPREQYKGFGTVFQKDGLVSSPLEERARMMFAISQQLEAMLTQIDGIVEAKVSVVLPERRSGRYTELPSAAVMVKHLDALDTTLLSWKIQRMVASSVPGLVDGDARQISISFTAVDSPSVASAAPSLAIAPADTPALLDADTDAIASVWTWRRMLPFAASATFLVGVVLLWLRRSNSPVAQRIVTLFGGRRSKFGE